MTATFPCGSHFYLTTMKTQKKRKRKIILYISLAVSFFLLCAVSVFAMLHLSENTPLILSVKDGEVITLEYGTGSLPEVTAHYRTWQYAKEDTYVDVEVTGNFGLSAVAATTVNMLGYEAPDIWDESMIEL